MTPFEEQRRRLQKPSRTARTIEKVKSRRDLVTKERDNKKEVRRRDQYRCRFPLCGCKKLGLKLDARLEVSHDRHKGMGGDPSGERSIPKVMILLCLHRHQDGIFSRHKGTLRARPLNYAAGNDGPVVWELNLDTLSYYTELLSPAVKRAANAQTGWVEIAREKRVQQLEPPLIWQRLILERLAEMDL